MRMTRKLVMRRGRGSSSNTWMRSARLSLKTTSSGTGIRTRGTTASATGMNRSLPGLRMAKSSRVGRLRSRRGRKAGMRKRQLRRTVSTSKRRMETAGLLPRQWRLQLLLCLCQQRHPGGRAWTSRAVQDQEARVGMPSCLPWSFPTPCLPSRRTHPQRPGYHPICAPRHPSRHTPANWCLRSHPALRPPPPPPAPPPHAR
mmetsp:Transcript_18044/g.50485  ORF Transcript_18044/g.50485 Transcript_18044/m.50485 type:complete len:201 (-) Transcript_18044:1909-2511(-)